MLFLVFKRIVKGKLKILINTIKSKKEFKKLKYDIKKINN